MQLTLNLKLLNLLDFFSACTVVDQLNGQAWFFHLSFINCYNVALARFQPIFLAFWRLPSGHTSGQLHADLGRPGHARLPPGLPRAGGGGQEGGEEPLLLQHGGGRRRRAISGEAANGERDAQGEE